MPLIFFRLEEKAHSERWSSLPSISWPYKIELGGPLNGLFPSTPKAENVSLALCSRPSGKVEKFPGPLQLTPDSLSCEIRITSSPPARIAPEHITHGSRDEIIVILLAGGSETSFLAFSEKYQSTNCLSTCAVGSWTELF